MRIAILDFGTNTFNLLIAETTGQHEMKILHSGKEAVKLGKGGITKKIITPEAIERGVDAITRHYVTIESFRVDKVYAFATSAIRDAENGNEFIQLVKEKFKLYVNIIPGEREAELIYRGVRQSYNIGYKKVLILDIGGGSNEFIIADGERIYWKHSFNLGMARLLEKFQPSDPISDEDIEALENHFNTELKPLFDAVDLHQPAELVGASGSFETFAALLRFKNPAKYGRSTKNSIEIDPDDFQSLHASLLKSTLEERKAMPGMEQVRVEMIVLASIFVNFTLHHCGIQRIVQSDYALKEGVVAEILDL
jgi:exopolyphosphatase/guanosine-5'-triphosphate,3'-diphosphate pyrophosphatase